MKLEKLLIKLTEKDEDAFNEFYNDYARLIFTIAFSILKDDEANDVVQNVCMKLTSLSLKSLPHTNAKSWLYSLIRNESYLLYKKKKRETHIDFIEISNDEINQINDKLFIEQCFQLLNHQEKEVMMFKLNGFKFREISQFIHKPTNTCIWLYHQAIQKIRRNIDG
ncbi:MAG: RNA polymerase sigma factor [Coprobacillus sp.]|nr:RNA polymerase sigma factor [Coprobacillus sp.]